MSQIGPFITTHDVSNNSFNVIWIRRYFLFSTLRFWFVVLQYHPWHMLCIRYKLRWWAANQNLFFGFYMPPVIWQKYKTKENCSNTLWLRKYATGEIFAEEKSGWGIVRLESVRWWSVHRGNVGRTSVLGEVSVGELSS